MAHDTFMAIRQGLHHRVEHELGLAENGQGNVQAEGYQRRALREVKRQGIRHWEFWRTVAMERHRGRPVLSGRPSDDIGRSRYTAFAFRITGGVAPLLVLWLPVLLSLPILMARKALR